MNNVTLVGRLTKDVDYRDGDTKVSRFTVAIDRVGSEKQADFIPVVCFGKTAENSAKYLFKGSQVGITGRIQTGSYENKDGNKVYTTDVIANTVEFLTRPVQNKSEDAPSGFSAVDDDIPF